MATIKKQPRKNYKKNSHTMEVQAHKIVYDTPRWKQLRKTLLMFHPICENCLRNLSTEVHHITPLSTAQSEEEMQRIGFDSGNLMCLCEQCHKQKHKH